MGRARPLEPFCLWCDDGDQYPGASGRSGPVDSSSSLSPERVRWPFVMSQMSFQKLWSNDTSHSLRPSSDLPGGPSSLQISLCRWWSPSYMYGRFYTNQP